MAEKSSEAHSKSERKADADAWEQSQEAGINLTAPERAFLPFRLNAEKLEQARVLLGQGHPSPVVSAQTGMLPDTLSKAIKAGRLPLPPLRT